MKSTVSDQLGDSTVVLDQTKYMHLHVDKFDTAEAVPIGDQHVL